jgi:hypothetical protein
MEMELSIGTKTGEATEAGTGLENETGTVTGTETGTGNGTETALRVELGANSNEMAGANDPLEISLGEDGLLRLGTRPVHLVRCFPWSNPLHWLSLRDDKGEELVLLETMHGLSDQARRSLVQALVEASFVFAIEAIESVSEEFELRHWQVRLKEGRRKFQTQLSSWPREVPGGGLLIQDVANDFYLIADLTKIDAKSTRLLAAFLDD